MERSREPVDVICVCGADGEFRPLRMQIPREGSGRIDILEVLQSEAFSNVGAESLRFLCRGRQEGRECMVELQYALRSHIWHLTRKVY